MIEKDYAERVPSEELSLDNGRVWYIPHHGVYHPKKPGKIRAVFDASAEFKGESLKKHLLQGPDLTNSLTGVLCRFRKEPVAFICDIEGMFHQVNVNDEHRNLLRFLWGEQGDMERSTLHDIFKFEEFFIIQFCKILVYSLLESDFRRFTGTVQTLALPIISLVSFLRQF